MRRRWTDRLLEWPVERCRSRFRVQTTQPAGREAWFDPGVFVAAVLDGLTPGARYYYMCARRLVRARARVPRGTASQLRAQS